MIHWIFYRKDETDISLESESFKQYGRVHLCGMAYRTSVMYLRIIADFLREV